ncbi:metallophosphoesterase [Alphaproteobacteria bacterium GH1-50]|uniref:Metallophosphoesterase n=1 Tax=Kangsaoukella pontilimi TaxID=2691042 RepID=A0A7C9MI06_9RHOB|nr:metallophosphoesterase family protein [Kangsaoukella pontilimi]MXQ06555.1 metallophosphoesterase [Kangsaoukella pontilimi]
MRIAVLSDIHGNIAALEAVIADIARRSVDATVNLGDTLSGPFDAAAVADRVMAEGWPTVSGNHDHALWDRSRDQMGLWETWIIDDLSEAHLDWLRALPTTQTLEDAFFCHATPESDEEDWLDYRSSLNRVAARDLPEVMARLGGVTAPAIGCGHTHTPRAVRLPTGQLVVNPGSVGCPAYHDTRFDPAFIQESGAPDARYAILERSEDGWTGTLLTVPYDSREMAAMARAKGAESWARAVETGWITGEG